MSVADEWAEAVDAKGRMYWYHKHTRSSTWDDPYANRAAVNVAAGGNGAVADEHEVESDDLTEHQESMSFSDSYPVRLSTFEIEEEKSGYSDAARYGKSPQRRSSLKVLDNARVHEPGFNGPPYRRMSNSEGMSATGSGSWIECREVLSNRTLFYNSVSKEIVFDTKPRAEHADIDSSLSVGNSGHSGHFPSYSARRPSVTSISVKQESLPSSDQISARTISTPTPAPVSLSSSIAQNPQKIDFYPEPIIAYTPLVPDVGAQLSSLDLVNELLGTFSLAWNFNNPVCRYYRAKASHSKLCDSVPPPQALLFPRYFSNIPIPTQRHIVCTVKIPDIEANNGMSYTKIHCSGTDSANDMVWKALKKCTGRQYEPEKCLLKAIGTEEYIYGTANIVDFEYIRSCIHTHEPIRLSLLFFENLQERVDAVRTEMQEDAESPSYPADILGIDVVSPNQFEEACDMDRPVEEIKYLPINLLSVPLRFQIWDLENIQICPRFEPSVYAVCIEVKLMLGTFVLPNTTERTRFRRTREGLLFTKEIVMSQIDISTMPLATILVLSVFGVRLEQKEVMLAFVKQPLIEHDGCLVSGRKSLPMWIVPIDEKNSEMTPDAIARATSRPNLSAQDAPTLNIRFDDYMRPIIAPTAQNVSTVSEAQVGGPVSLITVSSRIRNRLERIIACDSLTEFTDEEKGILWMARHNYTGDPTVLPKLLRCVDWQSQLQTAEAYRMMYAWARPRHPFHALLLLDVHYPDYRVREYAVNILDELSDFDLQQVLLQLVQTLKFEIFHDSPMSRFLLRRGVKNPYQIGHFLFWHLKAELHHPAHCERFALILENYLVHFKRHARELQTQDVVIKHLQVIAENVAISKNKELLSDSELKTTLRSDLAKLNETFPSRWQIALNPKWQVKALKPNACKYMSSKKLPLWLCFENSDSDGQDFLVIFKTGDDLRQDLLTLQLLRIMDRTWLRKGQDMAMKPYTCVATGVTADGEGVGMIEVVQKSNTISRIQIDEGGGALGAINKSTLVKWLQKYNRGETAYKAAVDTFMRSCAGYCVATFCLGVGDRHNDNIMLTQDGHLFHIDFGHFLGNFKSKYGFNREKSPFVFTPEMAQVMGGEKSLEYKDFVALCCSAFNVLRKEASMFINLFCLMISAGMPELRNVVDIHYLRDRLLLSLDEDAASKSFRKEIKGSLADFYRRVDNAIHNMKHK